LLAQVEDLGFASGLRATQPRQQRRKKSLNTDHSAKSLTDWKAVDRLDKLFGRDTPRGFIFASDVAQTVAIAVDHSKHSLILLREDGKDVAVK
jgi:hypothetical protein